MASTSSITAKIKDELTTKIIKALESGVRPWQRPWAGGHGVRNVRSKKAYKGINTSLLAIHQMDHNLASSLYGTFNQWRFAGSMVKKGSKGCQIIFWSPMKGRRTDADGNETESKYLLLKTYTVFAVDQTEKPEQFEVVHPERASELAPDEEAERVVQATGAIIKHGGDEAFYSPSKDFIQLPHIKQFRDITSYHGTQLHELIHWTGHEARCKRQFGKRFGNDEYAVEELVAEMGGCFLMAACGLPMVDLEHHASYLDHWLKVLKADSDAILTASSAATKGADYVLALAGQLGENEATMEPATTID